MRIEPRVQKALDECGKPYSLDRGARHIKITVAGKLAGILPQDGFGRDADKRSILNTVSQIRRAAR